jgi:hypothetical protein
MVKRQISFFIILFLTSCGFGAGTLGGFDTYFFPTSKKLIKESIDSLYSKHPEYKIPKKWIYFDDWKARGYDFLETNIYYFNSEPEEMYYVSFYGDANDSIQVDESKTGISVRAVNNGYGWILEKETSTNEKARIEKRFYDEIVSKIELYSGTISKREK